jgi:hypothetical protein
MNTKQFLSIVVLLGVSLACSFAPNLLGSSSGPQNLKAELTAPDVVLLTWDSVEGASGYLIEASIDGDESFPLIALPSEHTSFEHLTAPEKADLRYQVQVVTEKGPGGKSSVDITTGERIPNPLKVDPLYQEENSISAILRTQGGTLSAVDSRGVEYTLVIPQGAVTVDTEISMTPVSDIKDWPLDGDWLGAVKLEPEGLVLNDAATLSIGIPSDVARNLSIVGFQHQGKGEEFHLSFSGVQDNATGENSPKGLAHLSKPALKPKMIIINPVIEFKVHGAGQTSGNKASQLVKENAPTKSGDAFQQKQSANSVVEDELAPLSDVNKPDAPGKSESMELAKAIFNAESCKELKSQIAAYQLLQMKEYDRNASVEQQNRNRSVIENELKKKIKEILENSAEECEKSNEQGRPAQVDSGCAKEIWQKLANPSGHFWNDISTLMNSEFSSSEADAIKDKLDKCKKKAYFISGNIDEAHMQGYTCDSSKPFRIGGTLTFDFVPTNEKMGTYAYTGPFNATGVGPYLINNDGTLKISGYGCIDSFFGTQCADYDHDWTAEPIDPDQCVP